jgi:hypothetical protein
MLWGISHAQDKFAKPLPRFKDLLPEHFGRRRKLKPMKITWDRPPMNLLKINVDASFTPVFATGSAIIRDHTGSFIAAKSFLINATSAEDAETQTAFFALQWAIPLSPSSYILETDSQVLQHKVSSTDAPHSSLILRIRQYLASSQSSITHTYREANNAAHTLAAHCRYTHFPKSYPTFASLPCLLRGILISENMCIPYFLYK